MAIPAPLIAIGKQILAKTLYTKVTKEIDRKFEKISENTAINEDNEIVEIVDTIEEAVISKKKVSAWATVATALAYFASSQGWIDPAIADLVNTILSNPETVEAIEEAVE